MDPKRARVELATVFRAMGQSITYRTSFQVVYGYKSILNFSPKAFGPLGLKCDRLISAFYGLNEGVDNHVTVRCKVS